MIDKKQNSTNHNEGRQKCEVWTRVMGYHRPVDQFNKGKQSEHKERTHFKQGVTENSQFGCNVCPE